MDSDRLTVQARCSACAWVVEITGDNVDDVAPSLDNLARAHVREAHPEAAAYPPRMVVVGAQG